MQWLKFSRLSIFTNTIRVSGVEVYTEVLALPLEIDDIVEVSELKLSHDSQLTQGWMGHGIG